MRGKLRVMGGVLSKGLLYLYRVIEYVAFPLCCYLQSQ